MPRETQAQKERKMDAERNGSPNGKPDEYTFELTMRRNGEVVGTQDIHPVEIEWWHRQLVGLPWQSVQDKQIALSSQGKLEALVSPEA